MAAFVQVYFRVIQQKNVNGGHYTLAFITAWFIALGDIAVIISGVQHGWAALPYIASGGGLAAVIGMLTHAHITKIFDSLKNK